MATYFCDTTLTTGDNNGTTMDHAYRTIKAAMERTLVTGDILWIRRASSESPTADITPAAASDATVARPVRIIGWPRTTKAITSSDWTNGSTSVTVDDADMSRGHLGRYITAPSGKRYLITRVVDASTIIIDREYSGSTVTNQAATIHADEDYTEAQAIDDSGWTHNKAEWNADAHTLPVIDFGTGAFNVNITGTNGPWVFANMDFLGSSDSNGVVNISLGITSGFIRVTGCLYRQTNNTRMVSMAGVALFDRVIFEGNSSGASQRGIHLSLSAMVIKNSAIYGCGSIGINVSDASSSVLDNVNVGVEVANGASDISRSYQNTIQGMDVKLGGTNGLISGSITLDKMATIKFENYGKILGANRIFTNSAETLIRIPVVAGSGDPYKRTGGSDDVLQIFRNTSTSSARAPGWEVQAAEWRFWADTTSKSYRVYCQQVAMATLTAAQAFLEATYVDEYDDTSEYHTTKVVSDETITVRSDASDWSQYLELTNIQPAVAGWVTIRLMVQWYDADGYLYVDPMVVIS